MMRVSRLVNRISLETSLGCTFLTTEVQRAQTSNGEEMRNQLPREGSVFRKALPLSHLRRDFPTVTGVAEPD